MKSYKLVHGDRLDLFKKIKKSSAQLIITSPPYNIGKSYEKKKPLNEYLLEQEKTLRECFRVLKKGGKIRILIPDFKKIFKCYINKDVRFFKVFMNNLNYNDLKYYSEVYQNPNKIKKERKGNLPPKWHLSRNKKDRENVALRSRKYNYLIEVVDWMVHQYGEHQSLYDLESLKAIFVNAGFKNFKKVKYNYNIDIKQYARKIISICFEAKK